MHERIFKDKKVEKDSIKREASHLIGKQVLCFVIYNHTDSLQIQIVKKFGMEHKVRDHCHLARKYRGAARLFCNLQTIVVFINCFPIFDYFRFIFFSELTNLKDGRPKNVVISENDEKYLSNF